MRIQPADRKERTTERRDTAALSELLWAKRDRWLHGKPVRGFRQIEITSTAGQEDRRLTTLWKEPGVARARRINKVRQILRRHNLRWGLPTKALPTVAAVTSPIGVVLPEIDRLEMDHLLAEPEQAEKRLKDLEQAIAQCSAAKEGVVILSSMPGVGRGFTALSLAWRVGRVERFPRAHSLANSWGLTPGCRNSGESDQRPGRPW